MTEKTLGQIALEAACSVTSNGAPSKDRHLWVLYRAQAFYDWMLDPEVRAAEPPFSKSDPEVQQALDEAARIKAAMEEGLARHEAKQEDWDKDEEGGPYPKAIDHMVVANDNAPEPTDAEIDDQVSRGVFTLSFGKILKQRSAQRQKIMINKPPSAADDGE